MVRYYEIRSNCEAWGTSIVIHAWILALLLFIPGIHPPAEEPLAPPLELTLVDLGPPGDRREAADDRPAPKPEAVSPVREAPHTRQPIGEPRPAAVRQAPVHAAPRPAPAAAPVEQQVVEPDAAALEAEEARRRAAEEASRRALEEVSPTLTAYDGSGRSDASPPSGGMLGEGRGRIGDLSGRRVLETYKPPYPAAAEARHSEGVVHARIRVGPDGTVKEADLKRSSGDPDLDQAALAAFRRWRFSPLPGGPDQVGEVKMTFELQ